jgi:hypothetical protein
MIMKLIDFTTQFPDEQTCRDYSPDSKVKTDNYTSYRRLNEVVKKHTAKIVPPEAAGKELPWVHITISNA